MKWAQSLKYCLCASDTIYVNIVFLRQELRRDTGSNEWNEYRATGLRFAKPHGCDLYKQL